ncbi:hypothetical protein Tco_1196920 [Tanacetum coccineum]
MREWFAFIGQKAALNIPTGFTLCDKFAVSDLESKVKNAAHRLKNNRDRMSDIINAQSHILLNDIHLINISPSYPYQLGFHLEDGAAASNIWKLVRGWCDLKIPTLSSCDEWDIWYTS